MMGGHTVGNVVNLMSNDVNRFDTGLMFFHFLWLSPLQMLLIIYFLYREIGVPALLGMLAIFIFIPLQGISAFIFYSALSIKLTVF